MFTRTVQAGGGGEGGKNYTIIDTTDLITQQITATDSNPVEILADLNGLSQFIVLGKSTETSTDPIQGSLRDVESDTWLKIGDLGYYSGGYRTYRNVKLSNGKILLGQGYYNNSAYSNVGLVHKIVLLYE